MISIEEMVLAFGIATLLLKPNEMLRIVNLIKNFRSNMEKQIMSQANRFAHFCQSINKSEGEEEQESPISYYIDENGEIKPVSAWNGAKMPKKKRKVPATGIAASKAVECNDAKRTDGNS